MLYDKIIKSLIKVKKAIKEKWGDDGLNSRGGRTYSSGPDGFDRIQYEVERIAEAIRHSTIGAKADEIGALIPPNPPQANGRYVLVVSNGVLSWEAESE